MIILSQKVIKILLLINFILDNSLLGLKLIRCRDSTGTTFNGKDRVHSLKITNYIIILFDENRRKKKIR